VNDSNCFTCGVVGGHADLCPDAPQWRNRIARLSERQYRKLIPVGQWAYSADGLSLGEIFQRDQEALARREVPK